MGSPYTSDEVKYIQAIDAYNSKKIAHLPELMRIILPLKDVSRRVKDNNTVKNIRGVHYATTEQRRRH